MSVQPMSKQLEEVLTHNPWAGKAKSWYKYVPGEKYYFAEDKAAIDQFNVNSNGKTVKVHFELPPQPFIGDPDAPIWILHLCPGYSDIDLYDMVSIDHELDGTPIVKNCTKEAFEERRKSLFRQLDFSEPHPFYVLKEEFRTIKQQNRIHLNGTYGWWYNYLLEGPDSFLTEHDLDKCFVLEAFPYHCDTTDKEKHCNPSASLIRKMCHHDFWCKLVEYAFAQDKAIIARRGVASLVENCLKNVKTDKLCVFTSTQNIYLTKGNVAKRFKHRHRPTQAERDFAFCRITEKLSK